LQTVDLTYQIQLEHIILLTSIYQVKKQLGRIEIEHTHQVAIVQIHTERVIGNLRLKLSSLSSMQLIEFVNSNDHVTTMDKFVLVICELING